MPSGPLDRAALDIPWIGEQVTVRMPGPDENGYLIHRTTDEDEAELLREQLEARGVYCLVRQARGIHGVELEHADTGDAVLDVTVWSSGRDVAWEYVIMLRNTRKTKDLGS